MLLEPGAHTFALQVGDDEYRTVNALCETITIRIDEGISHGLVRGKVR